MKDLFEGTAIFFAWVALCIFCLAAIGFMVWGLVTLVNKIIKHQQADPEKDLIPGNHNW